MAPQWAAFLGLTGVVLVAMLALAWLSQQALEREPSSETLPDVGAPPTEDATATPGAEVDTVREADHDTVHDAGQDSVGEAGQEKVHEEENDTVHGAGLEKVQEVDQDTVAVPSLDPDSAASSPERTSSVGHASDPDSPARRQPSLQDLSPAALLANVAFTHGLFAGALVVGAWYFGIPAAAFGVAGSAASTGLPAVGLGIAFGLALWVANEVGARVADAMGVGYDETLRELLGPDSLTGWALLLGAVLPMIAVGEELMFRGALIGVPAAGFGVAQWALVIVSSVAFALGHGAQGRAGIVVTGVLGLVLGAGYVLSGSLLVVIVAHYLVNAMEFVVHEGVEPDWLPDRSSE